MLVPVELPSQSTKDMLRKDYRQEQHWLNSLITIIQLRMRRTYTRKSRQEKNQCHSGNSLHRRAVTQGSLSDLGRTLGKFTSCFRISLGYMIVYLALLSASRLISYVMNDAEAVMTSGSKLIAYIKCPGITGYCNPVDYNTIPLPM